MQLDFSAFTIIIQLFSAMHSQANLFRDCDNGTDSDNGSDNDIMMIDEG